MLGESFATLKRRDGISEATYCLRSIIDRLVEVSIAVCFPPNLINPQRWARLHELPQLRSVSPNIPLSSQVSSPVVAVPHATVYLYSLLTHKCFTCSLYCSCGHLLGSIIVISSTSSVPLAAMACIQTTNNYISVPSRRVGLPSSPRALLVTPPSPTSTLRPPSALTPGHSRTSSNCSAYSAVRRGYHKPSGSISTAATAVETPPLSPRLKEIEMGSPWGEDPRPAPPTPRPPQMTPQVVQVPTRKAEAHERKRSGGLFSCCFGGGRKNNKQPRGARQREPLYLVSDAHWTKL